MRFNLRAASYCVGLHLRVAPVEIIDLFRRQSGFGCTQSVVEVDPVFGADDWEDRKRLLD